MNCYERVYIRTKTKRTKNTVISVPEINPGIQAIRLIWIFIP